MGNRRINHPPLTSRFRKIKDSSILLRIFPEKLWDMVLQKLTDPEDLENICNASLYFRLLLTSQRVSFLFPKAWMLMGKQYNNLCWDKFKGPVGFRGYNKHVSEITKLRTVCRIWCKAIDDFYQKDDHHFKLRGDAEEQFGGIKHLEWTTCWFKLFKDFRFADRFNHEDGNADRNPFIGRSVELSLSLLSECHDEVIHTNISKLLSRSGHHIWYVTIEVRDEKPRLLPCYRKLREWLLLMPNLKCMFIQYISPTEMTSDPLPEELSGIALELILRPLPKLEYLKYFRTENLPVTISNAILSNNRPVSMLDLNQRDIRYNYDLFSRSYPNLTQITIKFNIENEFEILEASSLGWGLTKLNLSFNENIFIQWSRIFSLLQNKWRSTLINLVLRLPKAKTKKQKKKNASSSSLKLNLPFLKSLAVTMGNASSLDFILPMQGSLEVLKVGLEYYHNERRVNQEFISIESEQVIKFIGQTWLLHQSNIWKLFESLRHVVVTELVVMGSGCRKNKLYVSHKYNRNYRKETKWMSVEEYMLSTW